MSIKLTKRYAVVSESTFKEGTVVVLQRKTSGGIGYKAKAFFDRHDPKRPRNYGKLDLGDRVLTTVYDTKQCAGNAKYVEGVNGRGYCVRKVTWADINAYKQRVNPVLARANEGRVHAKGDTKEQTSGICEIDGQYFNRNFSQPLTVRTTRSPEDKRYTASHVRAVSTIDPRGCQAVYVSYRIGDGKTFRDWLFDMGSEIYRKTDISLAPLFKVFGLANSADYVDMQSTSGGYDVHHFDLNK